MFCFLGIHSWRIWDHGYHDPIRMCVRCHRVEMKSREEGYYTYREGLKTLQDVYEYLDGAHRLKVMKYEVVFNPIKNTPKLYIVKNKE